MKTVRLYDLYPYDAEFEAVVVSCEEKDGMYDVILDRTLFFPEQGGQTCDTGTLNGMDVLDVQIQDDIIHHYVKESLHGKVKGIIDFEERYRKMQHHSAEHVMSSVMIKLFGMGNVGFHLGSQDATVDFERSFSKSDLDSIENEVNACIYANKQIRTYILEDDSLEYRSKKEITGDLRIVNIEDIDICACCAPHVKATGEIGIFKIIRMDKHKKGVRITFIAGKKAFEDYQIKANNAKDLSVFLKVPPNEIVEPVYKLMDETILLKQKITALKKEILQYKLNALQIEDYHFILEEDMDMNMQRIFGNQLLEKTNKVACVFVPVENGYRFVMMAKNNVLEIMNILRKEYTIKGGGKGNMAQGTIEGDIDSIMKSIQSIF